MRDILKDKVILITGGTGTFGKAFVRYVFNRGFKLKKLIIFIPVCRCDI